MMSYRNKHLPKVIVYERNDDCKLCGDELNPHTEYYYRHLRVCLRCHEELKKDARKQT